MEPRLVLASGSPRRAELLRSIGLTDFALVLPEADETFPPELTPEESVIWIARAKAKAAEALTKPNDVVITADTLVFLGGEHLGKPRDEADALRMLKRLSGRRHTVCTGVAVRQDQRLTSFASRTDVVFRDVPEPELRSYIAAGHSMDKAGAYGIQGLGALLVERIEGDFYNVMGLPLLPLAAALKDFGISLLGSDRQQ